MAENNRNKSSYASDENWDKNKSRYTKAGVISGKKPSYKKAFVTVAEGENIDLYSAI